MKKALGIMIIVFVFLLSLAAIGGYWLKKNIKSISFANIWNSIRGKGKIELNGSEKENLKGRVEEVELKAYEEAAEHNPGGDVLPDEVDDMLKEKLKEKAKERIE
jgi:DNA-binding IscR family transcriptional regulator